MLRPLRGGLTEIVLGAVLLGGCAETSLPCEVFAPTQCQGQCLAFETIKQDEEPPQAKTGQSLAVQEMLVATDTSWQAVWTKFFVTSAPTVDFAQDMAVAVFLGGLEANQTFQITALDLSAGTLTVLGLIQPANKVVPNPHHLVTTARLDPIPTLVFSPVICIP